MGTTPKLALPYPELTDSANVPRDVKALADKLDATNYPLPVLAAAPANPRAGETYFNSATGREMIWDGTSWRTVDATAVGLALDSLLVTSQVVDQSVVGVPALSCFASTLESRGNGNLVIETPSMLRIAKAGLLKVSGYISVGTLPYQRVVQNVYIADAAGAFVRALANPSWNSPYESASFGLAVCGWDAAISVVAGDRVRIAVSAPNGTCYGTGNAQRIITELYL